MRALLVAGLTFMTAVSVSAQDRPEPFLLLEVSRDCATPEEDQRLVDALTLRMPNAFVVRGTIEGVDPDWRVAWQPASAGCELWFRSARTTSMMALGPNAIADEIELAASRVAWLASVSPPLPAPAATSVEEPAPATPDLAPAPTPEPTAEPTPEPPEEPAPQAEPAPEAAPDDTPPDAPPTPRAAAAPNDAPLAPPVERVPTKIGVWPGLVVVPTPFRPQAVPYTSLNLIAGRDHAVDGAQLSLLYNDVATYANGVQIVLGANRAREPSRLVQLSTGYNRADDRLTGGQVGLLNRGADLRGFQVGLLNIGREVQGTQVGLANIARTSDFSLGLVNVMYGEPLYVEASLAHTGGLTAGLKHGSKYLRWSYHFGVEPFTAAPSYRLGLGLGLHLPLDALFFDLDAIGSGVVGVGDPIYRVSQLVQLRFDVGWRFARRLALFAGVDAKALVSGLSNAADLAPTSAIELGAATTPTRTFAWPEFHAGVRF